MLHCQLVYGLLISLVLIPIILNRIRLEEEWAKRCASKYTFLYWCCEYSIYTRTLAD